MAENALLPIFSYVGWTFLPTYVTTLVQGLYYRVTIRAGQARPQPGQPLYIYHHRRIRLGVLGLYLLYTLLQALYDVKVAGDLYTILGVTPYSTDREVKARFRRLAARFHPDKVRDNGPESPIADAAFVRLRLAQDTILDPVKRFAYDRFGPTILQVQHPGLKTIKDYVYAGLRAKTPEYAMNALLLIALNLVWFPKWGQFWRYLAIASLVFMELFFLTHSWNPPGVVIRSANLAHGWMGGTLPAHLLPFQILALARRMSLSLNIFISQLAPPNVGTNADKDRQAQQQIAHLSQIAHRMEAEADSLLRLGLVPFKGDAQKSQTLKKGMRDGIIMSAVRSNADVREAVRGALDRRKGSVGMPQTGGDEDDDDR